ncbi:hypothetical protein ACH4OV_25355 [Streptomyces diastaticus]|uniref:hypothetical protein n=1 Tax=Streptomyces diastaticus TaxID=1956 RepID=UPI0037AB6BD1
MSMAELVAAGAPELPEGYFYRVRQESLGLLNVEIRRQGRWFSTRVESCPVRPGSWPTAEEAVVAACCRAAEWWGLQRKDVEALKAARAWHGDHDPKGGR